MNIIKKLLDALGFFAEPERAPECLGGFLPYATAAERGCDDCEFQQDCVCRTLEELRK